MTVEIRTAGVKPVRNTFTHLARRFGDKQASRYQEIAYDTQPTANFHYKPLWDPERELYDVRRTRIVMQDWYALKDPRQFYYGSYTILRARQQDAVERQLDFTDKRGLLRDLPAAARSQLIFALLPHRHYEFGANLNNAHMAAYGYGTTIVQACMMNCMDRLGMAQHVTRLGLLLDGNSGDSLPEAKRAWTDDPAWQGIRREMENAFVTRDWMELYVVQNLIADALLYPLLFQHYDRRFSAKYGPAAASLVDYLMRWYEETAKWVDACVKTAAAESSANRELLTRWAGEALTSWTGALAPLAAEILAEDADAAIENVVTTLKTRAGKLGLEI